MKRWLKNCLAMGLSLSLLLVSGCSTASSSKSTESSKALTVQDGQKVKIMTFMQAQGDFAREIGKDKVDVQTLLPAGTNVWQWAPTLHEMKEIGESNLFIINGGGVEERWYDQTSATVKLQNPNLVIADPSKGIAPLKLLAYLNPDDLSGAKKDRVDPYFYLDPQNAKKEVDNILAAMIKVAPFYKDEFQKNADAYKKQLDDLDQHFATTLSKVKHKTILSPYPAYQYLAKRYGLQYHISKKFSYLALDEDQMDDVKAEFKPYDVHVVYFQSQAAPKVEDLLGKAGYFSGLIDSYEGARVGDKNYVSYIDAMKHTLEQLDVGLNK